MLAQEENIQSDGHPIPESDIRSSLARVLESAEFSRSKRVGSFLRFTVEEVLAGKGDRLKAFSIAREVYGRDESFDSRSDTIVRVEAGRLRRRLAEYYENEGRADPIRIALPKGGYTPTFSLNQDATSDSGGETTVPPAPAGNDSRIRQHRIPLAAGVLILAAILFGSVFLDKGERSVADNSSADTGGGSGSPSAFLAVLPLMTLADDPLEKRLAAGLVEAVITDLAKLSGLSVMAHASLLNLDSQRMDLRSIRDEFGATHALRGSLERDDDLIRVNVQLVDLATSSTIWADRLDGNAEDPLLIQDRLTERILNYLEVEISPGEQTLVAKRHSSNPEALALYRQALILISPPNDKERSSTVQRMFQRVIEIDPEFAGGYAGMGFHQVISVHFFMASDPEATLRAAIKSALQAIETDAEFGLGYVTLALAYTLSGRNDEALFNARRALDVQPGDAYTQFVYGLTNAIAGNSQEAVTALSEAIRLDPAEPRTPYRNVLGIAFFLAGDYSAAILRLEQNLSNKGPAGPHMDVFRAAAYAELGEEQKARDAIGDLFEKNPGFPVERWLAWYLNADELPRIMETLYRHGLPVINPSSSM